MDFSLTGEIVIDDHEFIDAFTGFNFDDGELNIDHNSSDSTLKPQQPTSITPQSLSHEDNLNDDNEIIEIGNKLNLPDDYIDPYEDFANCYGFGREPDPDINLSVSDDEMDLQWHEHDNLNLTHIKFQHDENNKIKLKSSLLTPTIKMANDASITSSLSRLLSLPEDIRIMISQSLSSPLDSSQSALLTLPINNFTYNLMLSIMDKNDDLITDLIIPQPPQSPNNNDIQLDIQLDDDPFLAVSLQNDALLKSLKIDAEQQNIYHTLMKERLNAKAAHNKNKNLDQHNDLQQEQYINKLLQAIYVTNGFVSSISSIHNLENFNNDNNNSTLHHFLHTHDLNINTCKNHNNPSQ